MLKTEGRLISKELLVIKDLTTAVPYPLEETPT